MCAPSIKGITSDDRLFTRQPEQSVIDRVSLDWPEQHNWTGRIAIEYYEAISIWRRFPWHLGYILLAKYFGPVLDFLVILTVNASTDVRRCVEGGGWECLEDGVGTEIVVWVVMSDEDSMEVFIGGLFNP